MVNYLLYVIIIMLIYGIKIIRKMPIILTISTQHRHAWANLILCDDDIDIVLVLI
jgi:hypothetical protein